MKKPNFDQNALTHDLQNRMLLIGTLDHVARDLGNRLWDLLAAMEQEGYFDQEVVDQLYQDTQLTNETMHRLIQGVHQVVHEA